MSSTPVGRVVRSRSTWQAATPPDPTPERAAVLDALAAWVLAAGSGRLRVAVSGRTAAGKSTLADELAERLAARGRTALRASLDDFQRPWRDRHLHDRLSGEGYYRNASDLDLVRRLLLDPAGPEGSGQVVLCSIDPLTQVDHSTTLDELPADRVLVVDGVFAFRPELDPCWDLRIWVEVDAETSLARCTTRDAGRDGGPEAAAALLRERYGPAEELHAAEVGPIERADRVVDNTDVHRPLIRREGR